MIRRLLSAILLPFHAAMAAVALDRPFVWFLFFPTVFFSARLGGLWAGLLATVLSAGMIWYFFIPPRLSWAVDNPNNLYSVGMFPHDDDTVTALPGHADATLYQVKRIGRNAFRFYKT